jgi:DnaJ-class molecular chaperone
MPGTACWREKCPLCKGAGKIQVWDKKAKTVSPSVDCSCCDGKGYILVKKIILRRKV